VLSTRPLIVAVAALGIVAAPVHAQLGERPGSSEDTSFGPKDLSGLSIKTPRARIAHTEDLLLRGGSYWLQVMDPYLAFKMGKDLTQREFQTRQAVFDLSTQGISRFRGKLTDGVTPAIVGNDQVSCGGCHNIPYRDAGGGTNFAKKSGLGRNATHFFGAGIQEMLAWQIRLKLMQQIDTNRNGWVDLDEMNDEPLLVCPAPGEEPIDYGSSGDADGDGWPDLNNIFRAWFVDENGQVVAGNLDLNDGGLSGELRGSALERGGAESLHASGVAGYNFILEVFGWGEKRFNLNTTNRVFAWDPWVAHGGLEAFDPTTAHDPDNDGWSQVSNAGFQQSWIGHIPPDPGTHLNAAGLSTDDPDGDGCIAEITEGDLDVTEWYMLNSPRPGRDRVTPKVRLGEQAFGNFRCNACHVLNWEIEAADLENPDVHQRYLGDLRFFDLDVTYDAHSNRLEGQLEELYDTDPSTGEHVRRRGSFLVEGIGTDFKHHEMGPAFADMQYDGAFVTAFRTGLLWGNGSTGAPWGHDGKSMSIDDVIRRHGGEAQLSRDAYVGANRRLRDAVVAYLETFVLYPTDQIACDVDGDGVISEHFMVQGKDTGLERFNPEWFFRVQGEIEGNVVNPDGVEIRSDALVNVREAYGLDLEGLVDTDKDGFPDVLDPCPTTAGFRDGCSGPRLVGARLAP